MTPTSELPYTSWASFQSIAERNGLSDFRGDVLRRRDSCSRFGDLLRPIILYGRLLNRSDFSNGSTILLPLFAET